MENNMNNKLMMLNVDDLYTEAYNRKVDVNRVKKYIKTFRNDLLGIVLISERDGNYYIVDGQHRILALKALNIRTVKCDVRTGLTYEEEARLFHDINDKSNRKDLNTFDSIKGLYEARDQLIVEMHDVVWENGFELSDQVGDNKLACASTVKRITERWGSEILDKTLSILRKTWNGDSESLRAPIVEGLAYLLKTYGEKMDYSKLPEKLKNHQPSVLMSGAEIDPNGGVKYARVARQFLKNYNKHLGQKNKLKDIL